MLARDYLREQLELECYKKNVSISIDDELIDIIYAVILDAELYDMLLRLDY